MKATELKIGDWVYFDNPAREEKEVAKVAAILNDVQLNIVRLEDNAPLLVVISDILPIPLTKEILEKNGWEEKDGKYVYEADGVVLLPSRGIFFFYMPGSGAEDLGMLLKDIAYVHELQHLLWALGIDDDLKI